MPPIPPECIPIQQEINAIDAMIEDLQEELSTAPPSQKPGIIAQIAEQQELRSEASARLNRCIAGADSYLYVWGAERTQAIQYFKFNGQGSGAGVANSVPLVARKSLIMRVYVARQEHDAPFPTSVSGTLGYRRVGGPTFPVLAPVASPIVARKASDIDRGDVAHTLNFRIPAGHCVGTLNFTVNLFDPGIPGFEVTKPLNPAVFREVPLLRLHGVLIRYTGNGLDLAAPTGEDFVDSLTYLFRTYPISGVQYTGCDVVEFDGDLTTGGSGCGDGWNSLLRMLANMRDASGTDDVFVGLLPNGTPMNQFSGCGRSGVCAGLTGNQILIAHEIGHALRRGHAPCGNPNNVDEDYPDYAGYPSASIGEFGVNSVTLAIRDPATTYDYMSYCGPKWTSPYTYAGIMNHILATAALRHPEGAELREDVRERLYLNFRVRGRQKVELLPSYHLRGAAPRAAHGGQARFAVELLGSDGEVLEIHRCLHTDPHRHPDDDLLDFHEVVTWHEEVRSIAFRRDGELLDTVQIEPDAPALRLVDQPGALADHPEVKRIEWEFGDGVQAVPEARTSILRYSNDDGVTWRAVAADLTGTSHIVNTTLLPGGERCLFQIVATSGIRTATVETEPLTVERKPRLPYLLAPRPGATYHAGAQVVMRGGGFSPDAQTTEFDEVSWSSNLDGALGVGYELVTQTLSPGKHKITMSFPDGLGDENSASVWIEVKVEPGAALG